MSEDDDKPQDDELTLVWEDDWEDEPATDVGKHRPPVAPPALTPPVPPPSRRVGPVDELDPELDVFDLSDDEDADAETRIAEIPDELIATLQELEDQPEPSGRVSTASTKPPPAGLATDASDLLDLPETSGVFPPEARRPPEAPEHSERRALEIVDEEDDEATVLFDPDNPPFELEPQSNPQDAPVGEHATPPEPLVSSSPPPVPRHDSLPFRPSDPEIESAIADVLDEEWSDPSLDDDLTDLAPPSEPPGGPRASAIPPPPAVPGVAARTPLVDRVAQAARRTVRSRKPRVEHMPLVGEGEGVSVARRELLYELAQGSAGAQRAALFVQAGALAEAQGDLLAAREAYDEARHAHAASAEALRALQRLSALEGDWPGLYEQLVVEAELTSLDAGVRAEAAAAAAGVALAQLDDPARALEAAQRALALDPTHPYAASLVVRARAGEDDAHAQVAMLALADRCEDGALAGSLRTQAAVAAEQGGEDERALGSYQRALESDPSAVDASLGIARTAWALGQYDVAQRALGAIAAQLPEGPRKAALERPRARALALHLDRPLEALPVLQPFTDAVALRERARWARAAGDPEPALRARAEHSVGTERALAYIEFAEWNEERNDHAEAERCLALAREADGTLTLTRVVREVLARRAGDVSGLAEAAAEDSQNASTSLAAAARLAGDAGALEGERDWLRKAAQRGGDSAYTRVLLVDAAAQAGDHERVTADLERSSEHADAAVSLASFLAIADRAARAGDRKAQRAALRRALEVAPSEPLTLRAMGRTSETPEERASWLEREASLSHDAAAASLHLARARLKEGDERRAALEEARTASREYMPGRLARIGHARATGDLPALHALCEEAAEVSEGAAAVPWLVRAALIGAETDPDAAAHLLVRAAHLSPGDTILRVLVSRVGDVLPADLRAEMFEHGIDDATDPLARARSLNAAGAFEDAGMPERALPLYSAALALDPEDALARAAVDRLNLERGDHETWLSRAHSTAQQASAPLTRLRAYQTCMRLAFGAGELQAAERFAREGLAVSPSDAECARTLERCLLAQGHANRLLETQWQLLDASTGPLDRGARLRLVSTLLRQGEDHSDQALDATLCRLADRCTGGPWLARRLITAGRQRGESHAVTAGWTLLLNHAVTASERASVLLRLGERHPPQDAHVTDMLRGALQSAPDDSAVAEQLAQRLQRVNRYSEAAEILEQAARSAESPERQVRLWYHAAVLWQDHADAPERARATLRAAADVDVGYSDVSTRLERLLGGEEDVAGLIALTQTRLSAGGPPGELAQLHRNLADLQQKAGDLAAARENLRAALALDGDDLDALRKLAALYERDQEYRECAETWIQIARKLNDPAALVDVFYKLGRLYDEQLPDSTRAVAAYRRVLKLDPTHTPTLRALSNLCEREGKTDAVIDTLARWVRAEREPDARRDVVLRLAGQLEAAGRGSDAEQVLENLRKGRPTDLKVLTALAALYRKQAAGSALAMHTNRAAGDLRHALAEHIEDPQLWRTLIEVLSWRGRAELPRIVATTGVALGVDDPQVHAQALDPDGLGGAGAGALEPSVVDLLAQEGLSRSLRHVLAEASEVFEKVMPFDPRAAEADKLPRKHPLRGSSREVARWFGLPEAEIWVSPRVPTAFLTVSDSGPTFVVGSAIVDGLEPPEQRFLLARAYAFAGTKTSVVCRVSPDDLAILLHGLVRAFVEDHAPLGLDKGALEATAQRIQKVLPRRLREQLHDEVVEVGGAHDFDPTGLYALCSRLMSRVALVATGAVHGSLSALCKLAGGLSDGADQTVSIRRTREARQLASFVISETHFEARRRAGGDGG